MTFPWYAGRSKPDDLYDEVAPDSNSSDWSCSDIFPSCLLLSFGIVVVLGIILAYLNQQRSLPVSNIPQQPTHSVVNSLILATPTPKGRSIEILVDDFNPQPYQGDTVYYFNRLEGDRGAINNSIVEWGKGLVRTTISTGNTWGGVWMSLNHPIRENQSINFSSILPSSILPAYQSQITGIMVDIARGTPRKLFKLELKDGSNLRWRNEIILDGGQQLINFELPALNEINQLVWVLDQAASGDYVDIDQISFTATTEITDPSTAAFVWSYGMLLNNWNPATGLVRDKAKDASGEFDAIQATGSLAAATALAQQLGVIERPAANRIVAQISQALLVEVPRYRGLWPHWVKTSQTGEITIVPDTEWSSVDTAIAAIGLLDAQSGLGLDTYATEQLLQSIDWSSLVTPTGISHGFTYSGDLIPYAWDVFGGESWLVELAYAGVTGQVAPMAYPSPPTANGSGFIDELAWLYVSPPSGQDYWGTDWTSYRLAAAENQVLYYPTFQSTTCFSQLGLFGLSAAEVPVPSMVPKPSIYQAFRVGGRFETVNDGSALLDASVVTPHYSAMIASLRPEEAVEMWAWLIDNGHFSPLTNVESLMFKPDSSCGSDALAWNQLKGSWNLSLQTLGWGIYLTSRDGQIPILWQATTSNPLLQRGYNVLAPDQSPQITSPTPSSNSTSSIYERECEYPDEYTIGQMIWRSNASGTKVHGQFGTLGSSPYPAQPGYVKYTGIRLPQNDRLFLKLRYSKYSSSSVPIQIFLDDEPTPRASFYPADQGNWDRFTWTEPILLGDVAAGDHSLIFSTEGQQYGVADLDAFVLQTISGPMEALPTPQTDNTLSVWYDFEGDFLNSGSVTDRSGYGYDAQVIGSVSITEGVSGNQAILFSGNGYILAQSNPVAGKRNVSFSLWFKTEHPENNFKLASAAWWSGGPGSGWILATHIPEFWSDDTKSLYFPDINNNENYFPADEWIHEVITYDGQRFREYTNGQLVNDWAVTGAAIGQGRPMAVGCWPDFGFNFVGAIDEFRVYDRALTPEEIQTLYIQR